MDVPIIFLKMKGKNIEFQPFTNLITDRPGHLELYIQLNIFYCSRRYNNTSEIIMKGAMICSTIFFVQPT
jgi:hypothetical protein